MKRWPALFLPVALIIAQASAATEQVEREIQYLLDFVASSNCTFVRNGDNHDAADAADHLRLKYNNGKRYVDTAEDFIDRLASESSWTGRDYNVDCQGEVLNTGPWLHQALQDYREAP